jgi:ABC-type branched-subunit amino acid transport system substrate-binding protein
MRAMDWAVEQAGGSGSVQAGIVYQQDDYGQDGLDGWRTAAAFHGVEIVSEQAVSPGQSDFTAIVSTLRANDANFVLISALPGATSPLLGTAQQLGYEAVWLGNTPSWGDEFFDASVVPPAAFESYYNVSSVPFWGEDVPGMDRFLDAYERFGHEASADWYTLMAYLVASLGAEAFRIALEAGDVTRDGYLSAMGSIDDYDVGGLLHEPMSLIEVPYRAATRVRVLRPSFETGSWSIVSDFAEPLALAADTH